MELELPRDWIDKCGGPLKGDGMDFPEWLDVMTDELKAQMSSAGWDPTMPLDPAENTLLNLEQAVCLPEFGGQLFLSVEASIPSPIIKVKTLRNAMEAGRLAFIKPGKNTYVTRKMLKEWMENSTCVKNSTTAPSSASGQSATTKTESSLTAAASSSTTSEQSPDKLRQAALSSALKNMLPPKKRRN